MSWKWHVTLLHFSNKNRYETWLLIYHFNKNFHKFHKKYSLFLQDRGKWAFKIKQSLPSWLPFTYYSWSNTQLHFLSHIEWSPVQRVYLKVSFCDPLPNCSTDTNVEERRNLSILLVQGKTKRRGCCCISCWQWGTQHSSWRWHQAVLLPDSVSWLEEQNVNSSLSTMIIIKLQPWGIISTVLCDVCPFTFIYGTLLYVRSEEERRSGVDSIQVAHTARFSAEKRRAAPWLCRVQTEPQ